MKEHEEPKHPEIPKTVRKLVLLLPGGGSETFMDVRNLSLDKTRKFLTFQFMSQIDFHLRNQVVYMDRIIGYGFVE